MHCGHRTAVEIDATSEVLVTEASERIAPREALALVGCPACRRRDRIALSKRAVVPAILGLAVAFVGTIAFVPIGLFAIAGPDTARNEARFPTMVAVALGAAVLLGVGVALVRLRATVRRAERIVRFTDEPTDAVDAEQAAPPAPVRDPAAALEDRKKLTTGIVVGGFAGLALLGGAGDWHLSVEILIGASIAIAAAAVRGTSRFERGG